MFNILSHSRFLSFYSAGSPNWDEQEIMLVKVFGYGVGGFGCVQVWIFTVNFQPFFTVDAAAGLCTDLCELCYQVFLFLYCKSTFAVDSSVLRDTFAIDCGNCK